MIPAAGLQLGYRRLLRPVLFRARGRNPERVHESMISALAVVDRTPALRALLAGLAGSTGTPTTVAGIRFPGRVGLAAGMDKDGLATGAWQALGFGFAELGTVTAQPQLGNPRPRVFRLVRSEALINRMGFNNSGAAALADSLAARGYFRGSGAAGIPLGISLGKTKVVPVEEAVPDYLTSLRAVAPHADYVAVNVSSPNTPGLRSLQDAAFLTDLLGSLTREAAEVAQGNADPAVPVFVKIAPDLTDAAIEEILGVCADTGVAGIIATNTTTDRGGLAPSDRRLASQAGGLSGRPLTRRAREVVAFVAGRTDLPVIGTGGVMSADDAKALFDAGASLVQLYTGFIYRGPALIAQVNALGSTERIDP